MALTIDAARNIFPGTMAADAVPATTARFRQLSVEDQLALIWWQTIKQRQDHGVDANRFA